MIQRLLQAFKSKDPKVWSVGDHRVKKVTVEESRSGWKVDAGPHPPTTRPAKVYEDVTKFQCIDCEKICDEREAFEDERCYEVIDNG